jgi:16S rRNA (cytosine1402-N4)-methyltransferase
MHDRSEHRPVLLHEAVEALAVRPDGVYVDGTFGRGGHAAAILERLGEQGKLWLFDKDPQAVAFAQERFAADPRCSIHHGSFAELRGVAERQGMLGRIDGILVDLGVSSPQLDEAERGFSFMREGPLDMRMDVSQGQTAREWLSTASSEEIVRVLREYGEERFARRIAAAVLRAREERVLPETTWGFAELVAAAIPVHEKHKHPATRSFQALRIQINRELEDLSQFLGDVCDLLAPGGRLAAISFHSLEDRIVKRFIQQRSSVGYLPPGVPVPPEELRPRLKRMGKAVRASAAEIEGNPRARSAVLRIAERLPL